MKQVIYITVIALIMWCSTTCDASWIFYHKPEFKGRVVDIDTKQPIEGVIVVAIYYKSTLNPPGGSYSNIIHVKEFQTDKDGRFQFPSYTTLIHPLAYSSNCNFLIYKPGYGNLGKVPIEKYLSGKAASQLEIRAHWNNELVFRYLTNGTVEIPRLTTLEDMKDSWRRAGVEGAGIDRSEVPILSKAIAKEEETFSRRK